MSQRPPWSFLFIFRATEAPDRS